MKEFGSECPGDRPGGYLTGYFNIDRGMHLGLQFLIGQQISRGSRFDSLKIGLPSATVC